MRTYETVPDPRPRRGFFGTLVVSVAAVIATALVCVSGLAFYGLNVVDRKSTNLLGAVQEGIRDLPALRRSLPPVLADMLNDVRRPDYAAKLSVSADVASAADRHGRVSATVEIKNNGEELVSLLAMRVVILNENDKPVGETTHYGATPATADSDWPGPLMPGATRKMLVRCWDVSDAKSGRLHAETEITDVRVWQPQPESEPASQEAGETRTSSR